MALMDEFKEERAKVKEMSLRDKIDYFVYYHKVAIMLTVLIAVIAGVSIYDFVTTKDPVLYVALVDNYTYKADTSKYDEKIKDYLNIDKENETIYLNNSFVLSSAQAAKTESALQLPEILYTLLAGEQLNVFMAQESTFNGWVMNDGFIDLRKVMTPEQIAYYEDSFYWIDYDLLANYQLDFDKGAYVYNEDHRSPEGMKDPMPVGVYITPDEEFDENYTFLYDKEVVFALTFNTEAQPELALGFLDFLSGRTANIAN